MDEKGLSKSEAPSKSWIDRCRGPLSVMTRHLAFLTPNLPRASRLSFVLVLIIVAFVGFGRRRMREYSLEIVEQHVVKEGGGVYRILKETLPSVNLVVAAMSHEDYSWVKDVKIPGMVVIPYIADDQKAPYHPDTNKGHESMIYHQYFYDFYDHLPDVSILIHAQQQSWHVDSLLDQSTKFSLDHLDIREIQRRGYANLRVTWGIGCSSGPINTSRVDDSYRESGAIPEQKEMREAFRANFNLYYIPEILATPCCSQIAVTKERILSNPREQYKHHMDWLLQTALDDGMSGRTWEHMWQYLFLEKAIDCPIEHKAYCRLYHICFGGMEQYNEWIELREGVARLEKELQKISENEERREVEKAEREKKAQDAKAKGEKPEEWKAPSEVVLKAERENKRNVEEELNRVKEAARIRKELAIVRGATLENRIAEGIELYGNEVEPGVEKIILGDDVKSMSASLISTPTLKAKKAKATWVR